MVNDCQAALDAAFDAAAPTGTDRAVCMKDDRLLLAVSGNDIRFPTVREIGGADFRLFRLGDVGYSAGKAEEFGDYRYVSPAMLRKAAPKEAAFAGVTALHLLRWYRDHRYCGRCGRETRRSKTERALVCDCGNTVYPAICPAVIVGITDGRRICLTKYNRPNAGFALVAGYNEIGETLEDTVKREALEETGLNVTDIRYYKSQPWGLSGSVLAGFFCTATNPEAIAADGEELKEARWFRPEEIDFSDDGFSLTRHMIEAFRTGQAPA